MMNTIALSQTSLPSSKIIRNDRKTNTDTPMIQLNHINNFMSHDNASSKLTLIHTNLSSTTNDNNDYF